MPVLGRARAGAAAPRRTPTAASVGRWLLESFCRACDARDLARLRDLLLPHAERLPAHRELYRADVAGGR